MNRMITDFEYSVIREYVSPRLAYVRAVGKYNGEEVIVLTWVGLELLKEVDELQRYLIDELLLHAMGQGVDLVKWG